MISFVFLLSPAPMCLSGAALALHWEGAYWAWSHWHIASADECGWVDVYHIVTGHGKYLKVMRGLTLVVSRMRTVVGWGCGIPIDICHTMIPSCLAPVARCALSCAIRLPLVSHASDWCRGVITSGLNCSCLGTNETGNYRSRNTGATEIFCSVHGDNTVII